MKLPIKQYFRLLKRYLRPLKIKVLWLALLIFAGIGLQLWTPQLLRDFIDKAQQGEPLSLLGGIGVVFLAVTLVKQVFQLTATYVTEDVKWQATNRMRNDLATHCLKLDMTFHHENTPGTMIERIDGDINELSNFFSQFVLNVMGNVILLIGVLAMLYREHWSVGVAFTLFGVLMILALSRTVSFAVPFWRARRHAMSEMFGLVEEYLGGTEDIRATGATAYVMRQLRRAIYNLYRASRKAFLSGQLTWGTTHVFFAIGRALSLGLGAFWLSQGTITMGTVLMFYTYSNLLNRPLEKLARELQDLQSATASIKRIDELFSVHSAVVEMPQPEPLPQGALDVSFNDVTFAYHEGDPVLQGVTFDLKGKNVLGVLGRTGSGKTTMTRLLFRLYDPQAGQIRMNGINVRHLGLDEVRRRVGMVTQEVQLFRASVRDNLTFFDETVDDTRILEALEVLGLGEWLHTLPNGLDTLLASGGRSLSAGEAQLLAFTRVFLKDPGLVILDEASSRLDPVTEQLIEHAIDRLLAGRSAIIVAHRLATVQRAHDILILEDGQVAEFGGRVDLMNRDSRFARLLRTGGMAEVLA